MSYFDDSKRKEARKKARKKMRKKALKEQKKYEKIKAEAELIKDKDYVQRELGRATIKLERDREKRDDEIRDTLQHIGGPGETFKCKVCGEPVEYDNLTCASCGSLYCQYCGELMDQMNPGVCPKCKGVQNYNPAPLVITTVESMAPEDRFWEDLPECPHCGASIQPDWDECPICGKPLVPQSAPAGPTKEAPRKVKKPKPGAGEKKKRKRRGL